MGAKAKQIDQFIWRIARIYEKYTIGETAAEAVMDPLEKYFQAGTGSIAKAADEDLQKLLSITLQARAFAKGFMDKRIKKMYDATWLIEHLTLGGAGRDQDNQDGIVTLSELNETVGAVIELTNATDGLTDAVVIANNIDIKGIAKNLTSLALADVFVYRDIKMFNSHTRDDLTNLKKNIATALGWLKQM